MPAEMLVAAGLSVASAFALGASATIVPAVLIKQAGRRDLQARCRGKLALTYDDGPGPNLTFELLDLLRRHNAKATFFLVGFRALRSPESCDLLARDGHELGCHTNWHRHPWRMWPWNGVRDVRQAYKALSNWIPSNAMYRPPFGKLTTWTWLEARRRGAPLGWWTCDGCDTYPVLPDVESVARKIIDSGGAVVLLHSHDRGEERQRYVLDLTERLLVGARQHGYQVCTMSELYRDQGVIGGPDGQR